MISQEKPIIHDMLQNSPEWFKARLGVVTASEMDSLVTPQFGVRDSAGVENYLARKLAEKWLGRPMSTFSGGAAEQGSIREEEAAPRFTWDTGIKLDYVGFVTTADGRVGCSPDAMIADGSGEGLEIKCPMPETHIGYLLRGELPKEYRAQVHGSILVTGAARWHFMSYSRGLPPLRLIVQRDEKIIDTMRGAIDRLLARMDEAWKRLVELNDGEPEGRF